VTQKHFHPGTAGQRRGKEQARPLYGATDGDYVTGALALLDVLKNLLQ
jgi:hypothetical protein